MPATCCSALPLGPAWRPRGSGSPLGNDTCGRSDFSGSGRGLRAGLGSRRAAHPDRRGSRETPEAQESYLGCRRCPPVPGILGLGFAPPPGSAVAFARARARARAAPTRAQAPPSGRAEAARGPRPGEVGASAARAEMQPACPRGRRSGSPASLARARARWPAAPDHLPSPEGAGTRTCSTSSGEHRRASQALAPGLEAILGFFLAAPRGIFLFSRQLSDYPSLEQPLSEIMWKHPKMQGTGFLSSPGRPFPSHQSFLLLATPSAHLFALLPTLFPPVSLAEVDWTPLVSVRPYAELGDTIRSLRSWQTRSSFSASCRWLFFFFWLGLSWGFRRISNLP